METTLMKNMADFDTNTMVVQFVKDNKIRFDFAKVDRLLDK
jgi:hypothetical protein